MSEQRFEHIKNKNDEVKDANVDEHVLSQSIKDAYTRGVSAVTGDANGRPYDIQRADGAGRHSSVGADDALHFGEDIYKKAATAHLKGELDRHLSTGDTARSSIIDIGSGIIGRVKEGEIQGGGKAGSTISDFGGGSTRSSISDFEGGSAARSIESFTASRGFSDAQSRFGAISGSKGHEDLGAALGAARAIEHYQDSKK